MEPKGVGAKVGWKEGRGCQEPEWRETQRKQVRVWAARRLQKLGVDRERDLAEPELHRWLGGPVTRLRRIRLS